MAKVSYLFPGTFMWTKVFALDRKYDDYRCSFYPESDDVRRAIKATGTKCSPKEDKEGRWYYIFRSKEKPVTIDNSGNLLDKLIGNGTTGLIKIEIEDFESKNWGKVIRTNLKGIKVNKLIEYNPPSKEDEFEKALAQRGQMAKEAAELSEKRVSSEAVPEEMPPEESRPAQDMPW